MVARLAGLRVDQVREKERPRFAQLSEEAFDLTSAEVALTSAEESDALQRPAFRSGR